MLTFCSARAWQSLPSVPGLSSKRIVNSLVVGIGTSLWCTSGMGWRLPARSNDAWNPTPATQTHSSGSRSTSEPQIWLGPAQVIDFVVAMAGEVYDAHEQEVQIGNSGLHARVRDRAVGPRMSGSLVASLTRPQSLRVE